MMPRISPITAIGIPKLWPKANPRRVVRIGLLVLIVGVGFLVTGMDPDADAKYKGKVLEVTGQMLKFDKDRFGRLTVDLDAGEGMVRCDFPRGTENQLEKLKPTQKVTIRGRCTGRDRKDLIKLEDCLLVSRK
jgi:hypothetical protein